MWKVRRRNCVRKSVSDQFVWESALEKSRAKKCPKDFWAVMLKKVEK